MSSHTYDENRLTLRWHMLGACWWTWVSLCGVSTTVIGLFKLIFQVVFYNHLNLPKCGARGLTKTGAGQTNSAWDA